MQGFLLVLAPGLTVLTWCKFVDIFEFAAEIAYIIKACVLSDR